jgi:hypothetical protein
MALETRDTAAGRNARTVASGRQDTRRVGRRRSDNDRKKSHEESGNVMNDPCTLPAYRAVAERLMAQA